MTLQDNNGVQDLLDYLNASPTAFHATANACARLRAAGYTELKEQDKWNIQKGGRYFVTKNGSAFFAFCAGLGNAAENGVRMVAAHTDSPCFKIKPNSEMRAEGVYCKLNTGVYGGPILSSWFDRPLAVAGRVVVKGAHILNPEVILVNIEKPVLVIPNLAIHLDKSINSGYAYDTQKDTLPLLGFAEDALEKESMLMRMLCEATGHAAAEILDFDLYLYEYEKGTRMGGNDEFVSASRLDDLWMVHTGLEALCAAAPAMHTNAFLGVDSEEIGNETASGAASAFARDCLRRLADAEDGTAEGFRRMLAQSFIVSADVAHAVHPNRGDKHDATTRPVLGGGMVIKHSPIQKYATDGVGAAAFASVCEEAGVPYQRFANLSTVTGGSTIGTVLATQLGVCVADVGAPLLAMHSIRELAAAVDNEYAIKTFSAFYNK